MVDNVPGVVNSPVAQPMSERSTVTDGAELLALCSHQGARGLVLREPYSFKLL